MISQNFQQVNHKANEPELYRSKWAKHKHWLDQSIEAATAPHKERN